MAGPRWPDVVNGLLTLLPGLPGMAGVEVYDGQPNSQSQAPSYVTVGWLPSDVGGTFTQTRGPSGQAVEETGEVRCHLAVQAGDPETAVTRGKVFAIAGALQTALYSDRTLGGVLPVDSLLDLVVEVDSVSNANGTATSLLLNVTYWTSTYF
ncbi:MAG: hypothetical protein NVS3B26_16550 [Mycobacteriales bacterium]